VREVMKESNFYEDEFKLWVMLEQAHSAIFAAREKDLAQYKTSPMKVAVLFVVQQIGNEATPAEIARWILRKSHTVSGLLDRMEEDGLITRKKNLPKKNLVRVTITEKGKKTLHNSMKRESIRKIFAAIPKDERKQLYTQLEKLRAKGLKLSGFPKPPFPKSL
jgi:DNA-binding MarR family transcriptional regulator